MAPIFHKKYRSRKIEGQVALVKTCRTSRIKKRDVQAFLKTHYPDITGYSVRVLNQYKRGSVALITTKDKTTLWQ